MLLAHHSIFGMYGFWLPNDPRGSGSNYIAKWELLQFGKATKTDSPRSVAGNVHDAALRRAAKHVLNYPPVEITGEQALTIVHGFAIACNEAGYRVHACAVLPDHVHLVVGIHKRPIRQIVGHLKSRATRLLKERGIWWSDGRPVWGEHGWNVRLETATAVERAIRYVEENPVKEGKRRQHWSFVTPFDLQAALAIHRTVPPRKPRRLGGAALRSKEEKARRERRG